MMGENQPALRTPFWLTLGFGLIILLVGAFGFVLLCRRPELPSPYDDHHPSNRARVAAVNGLAVGSHQDIEFALWKTSIGKPVSLKVRSEDGQFRLIEGRIISYYDSSTLLVYLFIGIFTWGLGAAALLYKKNDRLVRIFFWLCAAFGFSVVVQGETYLLGGGWTTLIPALSYIILTALGPVFLLHFSMIFPGRLPARRVFLLYIPPLLLAAFFSGVLAYAYARPSLEGRRLFENAYVLFRVYMIVYCLAAIVRLARLRLHAPNDDVKAQAQWVFFGLIVGLCPFLFFFQLPKALLGAAILSENATALCFVFLPSALAIAIIKHRLFDVDVVINRSLVYSLLTILTAGIYLIVILVLQHLFAGERLLFSVIGVFAAAAAFHPAQRKIQDLVDRAFFRQKYDYRRLVLAFGEQAQRAALREDLLDLFLAVLRGVWAPDKAGLYVIDRPAVPSAGLAAGGIHRGDDFDESAFSASSCDPGPFWARPDSVRSEDGVSYAHDAALAANALELALPLVVPGADVCGWLALGRKRSGERFSREDLSLLRTMAGELMPNLGRIRLQEEVLYERASKERSDELNRLKTEFISTVSHELRTPMSSIQGVAELLQSGKIKNLEQREKFLALMVSESGRLSRFLHNVLDFGRIEQDVKSYSFRPIVVQDILRDVVEAFGLLLSSQGADVRIQAPARPVVLDGDEDALRQALMNLIDNAIKYSTVDKNVAIDVLEREEDVEIRITDHGIGIAPDDQSRIFERFYRTTEAETLSPRGAGLGLKIAKHIVEAHRGTILIESEVGRGSVFRLIFPKRGKA
jgi:signal transduction histidine kinase